jgi:hypothetical protein
MSGGPLLAQGMYWGGETVQRGPVIGPQGVTPAPAEQQKSIYMEKIADNLYKAPDSGVTYKIDGNNFWLCYDEAPAENVVLGNIRRSADRVLYYKDGNIAGYYTPADKRYYAASSIGDDITKEVHIGVLSDGKLYSGEGENQILYTVDTAFDPEALGMFLFFQ